MHFMVGIQMYVLSEDKKAGWQIQLKRNLATQTVKIKSQASEANHLKYL